jgi:hypothetical protein
MTGDDDTAIINAAQRLRDDLASLLTPADAAALDRRIVDALNLAIDAKGREHAAATVLEAIEQYSKAHHRFRELFSEQEHNPSERYQGVPGLSLAKEPGALYVCPVDPSHYQQILQFKGQRLWCSQHEVELVPEDKLDQ